MDRVHDNAVWHADLADLWRLRELSADNLMGAYVDNAIGNGVRHCHLAPLASIEIERIAHDTKIADGLVQMTTHHHLTLCIFCQPIDGWFIIHIVASGCYPQLIVFVCPETMQIRSNDNLIGFLHGIQINHTHRTLIALARHSLISTTVGHKKLIADDGHFLRLITYGTRVCLL